MKVYSCSMPNHDSNAAYFFAVSAHAARVFEGCGVMSVSSTSHITSLSLGPRNGSLHTKTGRSTQSELSPVAWFVLEPSKPQIPGCLLSAMTLVLLLTSGEGLVPSIQMPCG